MTKVKQDLTGQRFKKLVAIRQTEDYILPSGQHFAQYLCLCDCGNECVVRGTNLKSGHTKSCGKCSVNVYEFIDDYVVGYTSKGEEFYFDKEDYDLVKDYSWYINSDGYVITQAYKKDGIDKQIYMHRLIMGVAYEDFSFDKVIDHKKKGKIHRRDNRKENLWICTSTDNNHNISIGTRNTSGCIGVSWYKQTQKWRAEIGADNKMKNLGYFENFEDAVKARRDAEIKYWGKENQDFSKILEKGLDKLKII